MQKRNVFAWVMVSLNNDQDDRIMNISSQSWNHYAWLTCKSFVYYRTYTITREMSHILCFVHLNKPDPTLSVCQQRAAWVTAVGALGWICQLCSVSFLTVSYLRPSALRRIHQQSYSSTRKQQWKLREEMLALLLINCSQTNFSPPWKWLDRSRQCLKNISVSVTGQFLKSSQLETHIGLKKDVAKKDRSPHLFFLFLKDLQQHTPATAMWVKVYLREPAYLSNKASNATVLLPDNSRGFAPALWQLREGDTNTHILQEF